MSLMEVVLESIVDKDNSDEDIDGDDVEEDNNKDDNGSATSALLPDNDNDADPDDSISSKDNEEDTLFTNNAIGARTGRLR